MLEEARSGAIIAKEESSSTRQEIAKANLESATLRLVAADAEKRASDSKMESEVLGRQVEAVEEEAKQLKAQVQELFAAAALSQADSALDMDQMRENLQQQVEMARQEAMEATDTAKQMRNEAEQLQSSLTDSCTELCSTRDDFERSNTEVMALRKQLESAKSDAEEHASSLQSKCKAAEEQRDEAKAKILGADRALMQLRAEVDHIELECREESRSLAASPAPDTGQLWLEELQLEREERDILRQERDQLKQERNAVRREGELRNEAMRSIALQLQESQDGKAALERNMEQIYQKMDKLAETQRRAEEKAKEHSDAKKEWSQLEEEHKKEVGRLMANLDTCKSDRDRLQGVIDANQSAQMIDLLQQKLTEQEKLNDRLEAKLEKVTELEEIIDRISKTNFRLEHDLEAAKVEGVHAKSSEEAALQQAAAMKLEIGGLESELKASNDTVSARTQACEEARVEITALKAELQKLDGSSNDSELRSRLLECKEQYEAELEGLNEQIAAQMNKLQQHSAKNHALGEELTQEMTARAAERRSYEARLAALTQEAADRATESAAQQQTCEDRLAAAARQLDEVVEASHVGLLDRDAEIATNALKNDEKEQQIRSLQEKAEENLTEIARLKENAEKPPGSSDDAMTPEQVKSLEQKVASLESERSKLLEDLDRRQRTVEKHVKKLQTLNAELARLTSEADGGSLALADARIEIVELQGQLQDLQGKNLSLDMQVEAAAGKELEAAQQGDAEMQARLEACELRHTDAQKAVSEGTERQRALNEKTAALQAAQEDSGARYEQLEKKLVQLEKDLSEKCTQIAEMASAGDGAPQVLAKQLQEANDKLTDANEALREGTKHLDAKTQQVTNLKEALEGAEKSARDAEDECDSTKEALKRAEQTVQNRKAELDHTVTDALTKLNKQEIAVEESKRVQQAVEKRAQAAEEALDAALHRERELLQELKIAQDENDQLHQNLESLQNAKGVTEQGDCSETGPVLEDQKGMEELVQARKEASEMKSRLHASEEARAAAEKDAAEGEKWRQEIENSLAGKDSEVKALRTEVEQLQTRLTGHQELLPESEPAQSQCIPLQEKLEASLEAQHAAEKALALSEQRRAELESSVAAKVAAIEASKEIHASMEKVMTESKQRQQDLESSLSTAQQNSLAALTEVAQANSELAKLRESSSEQKACCADLEQRLVKATERCEESDRLQAEARTEIERLMAQMVTRTADEDAALARMRDLEQQVNEAEKKAQSLKEQLLQASPSRELARLERELAKLSSPGEECELSELLLQCQALAGELDDTQLQVQRLEDQLAEARAAEGTKHHALGEAQEENAALQEDLSRQLKKLADLSCDAAHAAKLTEELEYCRKEIGSLQGSLTQALELADSSQMMYLESQQEQEQEQTARIAEKEQYEARLCESSRVMEEVVAKGNEALQNASHELGEQLASATQLEERHAQEIASLGTALQDANEQLEEAGEVRRALEGQAEAAWQSIRQLERMIEEGSSMWCAAAESMQGKQDMEAMQSKQDMSVSELVKPLSPRQQERGGASAEQGLGLGLGGASAEQVDAGVDPMSDEIAQEIVEQVEFSVLHTCASIDSFQKALGAREAATEAKLRYEAVVAEINATQVQWEVARERGANLEAASTAIATTFAAVYADLGDDDAARQAQEYTSRIDFTQAVEAARQDAVRLVTRSEELSTTSVRLGEVAARLEGEAVKARREATSLAEVSFTTHDKLRHSVHSFAAPCVRLGSAVVDVPEDVLSQSPLPQWPGVPAP